MNAVKAHKGRDDFLFFFSGKKVPKFDHAQIDFYGWGSCNSFHLLKEMQTLLSEHQKSKIYEKLERLSKVDINL